MKRVTGIVIAAAALLMAANVASADVTMNSVRVAGTDTVALAKVLSVRLRNARGSTGSTCRASPEIFVNFGATVGSGEGEQGAFRSSSCIATRTA